LVKRNAAARRSVESKSSRASPTGFLSLLSQCLPKREKYILHKPAIFRNDHTTVTAALPVCSAKLSTVGPG
jgi:hypothetical protein